MPQMIAKKCFRYAGRSLHAGEEFSATAPDARALSVTGLAVLSTEAPKKRLYRRRDMRAQA